MVPKQPLPPYEEPQSHTGLYAALLGGMALASPLAKPLRNNINTVTFGAPKKIKDNFLNPLGDTLFGKENKRNAFGRIIDAKRAEDVRTNEALGRIKDYEGQDPTKWGSTLRNFEETLWKPASYIAGGGQAAKELYEWLKKANLHLKDISKERNVLRTGHPELDTLFENARKDPKFKLDDEAAKELAKFNQKPPAWFKNLDEDKKKSFEHMLAASRQMKKPLSSANLYKAFKQYHGITED